MPENQELERTAPQERPLGHMHLENGIRVYFIDKSSTPVAGRCRVQLLIRAAMEATCDHFSNYPDPSGAFGRFISLAGPGPVEFESFRTRNFIDPKEVEKTLEEMMDRFIRTGLQYLKNPGFAAKFVRRKYEELLAGAALRSAYEEAGGGTASRDLKHRTRRAVGPPAEIDNTGLAATFGGGGTNDKGYPSRP
jgi:hypothetical protein